MATYPPPYPPQQSAREQKRLRKAAERAQNRMEKLQRDTYLARARASRRSSILGPLLVIAIGVVALLLSTGRISFLAFLAWYVRVWPLLVIAAGVILLGEWAADQWLFTRTEGSLYARRGLGGGAVFLLFLLVAFGFSARAYHQHQEFISSAFPFDVTNLDQFFSQKYERRQEIERPFAPGGTLTVDNPHGSITVSGTSPDGRIHISVDKQIYAGSEAAADERALALSPALALDGSNLRIMLPPGEPSFADLDITLPDNAATTLSASHGAIHVANMHASVTLNGSRGDLDVSAIDGSVSAHLENRDSSFTAHDVAGDLTLHGRADDATITGIHGRTTLAGEFFGDIHLERLAGPVAFETDRTHFTVASIPGSIDMANDSELTGTDLTGPTLLHTRSRNISFDRISGPIDIANTNGSVDLTAENPPGPVTIQNRNGAVNLTLPAAMGFAVEARTEDGQIENDYHLQPTVDGNRTLLHASVGSGNIPVSLSTTHADITLHHQP